MIKTCAFYSTRRYRWAFTIATTALGSTLFVLAFIDFTPRKHLLYNDSPSMPIGYYRLHSQRKAQDLTRGETVLYGIPEAAQALVQTRHYSNPDVPFLKPVTAMPGDQVCTEGRQVIVNKQALGRIRITDSNGRPLPWHRFCGPVPAGFFYSFTAHPNSFDSRHYGPVPLESIVARATPLWTW